MIHQTWLALFFTTIQKATPDELADMLALARSQEDDADIGTRRWAQVRAEAIEQLQEGTDPRVFLEELDASIEMSITLAAHATADAAAKFLQGEP